MSRRVIVLGSTGSIGRNTLDVLGRMRDEWLVVGLSAGSSAELLAEQAERFRPAAVAILDGDASLLGKPDQGACRVFSGPSALVDLVSEVECDCVVCGVVGAAGLMGTLRAVELGRRVALANKEALVVGGSILMPLAKRTGAMIIPVDSEHSAIFQAIQAGAPGDVRRICLTASGGPFRTWSVDRMRGITLEDTLQHPTWDMGPKITIDSATMMNKALEIVEARWLFDMPADRIDVVVHPESIIHSLVEFCDGSMFAQFGTPDMRTPIQYALTHPARRPCPSKPLDLCAIGSLHMEKPDLERFPALRLGYEVARRGGTCGAVLNAANEEAVARFREGTIGFADITRLVEETLAGHAFVADPSLDELLAADGWAREEVNRCVTI